MKTSEILKTLEQMGRDKRSLQDILTAIARYRELAEAEEAAESKKSKPPARIKVNLGIGKIPRIY